MNKAYDSNRLEGSLSQMESAVAENKVKATAREGVVIGGGFAGGGAVAGLVCGPGALVCVTIGVLAGGAFGALSADFTSG
ncbi:MAG: hypothetical protein MI799_02480 [Desulfobacterales bacterium]|nr:hypothetical protein [Desulfobacterales bacterium]